MKKIFIIECNPKEHSTKEIFVNTYIEEAQKTGHEVRKVNVYDLDIDFLRTNGKDFDFTLNDGLKKAQEDLIWADQLVFVYPIWWLFMPAKLLAFIDIVFQEGVVADMGKMGPVPLLNGKTAVIIQSYDMPLIGMKLMGDIQMKWWKVVLNKWCGPKIVKRFDIDMVSMMKEKREKKIIKDIKKFVSKI